MTNKEKKDWLAVKYPLTVIRDRYEGTYSGARWLAFPLGRDEVPEDVDGEDSECMYFWKNYKEPVGRGAYASDAVADLIQQMRESEPEESEDARKEIVQFLKICIGDSKFMAYTPDDVKRWIAYLEKQKENPKSADSIPSDCASDAKCEDRWLKVGDFLPDNGRDVLAKDALGNYLIAHYDGDQWFISDYDNEDKPIVYTPAIKEWCDIPSEKQKEQKPAEWSEEDEKAAEEYRRESFKKSVIPQIDGPISEYGGNIKEAFIAGAEWQKSEDDKETAELLAIAHLQGMEQQKQQILKGAVEGIAHPDDCEIWVNLVGYGYKFNDGDKVKIVIIPDKE